MDISFFEQNYNNDDAGAAAYSPRVLLKIILYCYSRGILTSRRMEEACRSNIITKALAEDSEPDHATIAAFVSSHHKEIDDLFTQVVLQCSALDLITGEMFAGDGNKLPSDASKEWSGTIEELIKKRDKLKAYIQRMTAAHIELDKDKESKALLDSFRKTMGDDKERRAKSIERLEKKLEKMNRFLESAKPKEGACGEEVQSNITDNESALIKSPHGYIQGYNGVAIADSHSQVVISAEVTGSVSESGVFPRMLDDVEAKMKLVTGKKRPLKKSIIECDTGFFSEHILQEAAKRNIEVLIPDPQFRKRDPHFDGSKGRAGKKRYTVEDFTYDKGKDRYTCPGGKTLEYKCTVKLRNNSGRQYRAKYTDCRNCPLAEKCINKRSENKKALRALYIVERKDEENLSAKMREKIDKPVYRELYSRRMQIIEPVFSNISYHKGMDRFTLRGREKVNTQWKLYNIVHNMWKCMKPLAERYGSSAKD
jgi:transposase